MKFNSPCLGEIQQGKHPVNTQCAYRGQRWRKAVIKGSEERLPWVAQGSFPGERTFEKSFAGWVGICLGEEEAQSYPGQGYREGPWESLACAGNRKEFRETVGGSQGYVML